MPVAMPRQPAVVSYVLALLAVALMVFSLELSAGLGDVRGASPAALVALVAVIALLLWPVFALCIANLLRRQAWRTMGGMLHVACMVSLMLTVFADAPAMQVLPGMAPALLLALLAGWLAVEVAQLAWVQRRLQALAVPGTAPGASRPA